MAAKTREGEVDKSAPDANRPTKDERPTGEVGSEGGSPGDALGPRPNGTSSHGSESTESVTRRR